MQETEPHSTSDIEHNLSIVDAIREAMESVEGVGGKHSSRSTTTPAATSAAAAAAAAAFGPQSQAPSRRASTTHLRSRQSAPRPLFEPTTIMEAHQLRGFNPSPVRQAMPGLAEVTASNEHAFAGRDEHRRRPLHLPLGNDVARLGLQTRGYNETPSYSHTKRSPLTRPPSSPLVPSPASPSMNHDMPMYGQTKSLRSHRSLGEGLKGLRHRFSTRSTKSTTSEASSRDSEVPPLPNMPSPAVRDSFRSGATTNSSTLLNTNSIYTTHSSWTAHSSSSDYVNIYPNWPGMDEEVRPVSMTVEDAIGMYEDGFESAGENLDAPRQRSIERPRKRSSEPPRSRPKVEDDDGRLSLQENRPASQPIQKVGFEKERKKLHRRSQSARQLLQVQDPNAGLLKPHRTASQQKRTFSQILAPKAPKVTRPTSKMSVDLPVSRDRYGFKKASHYITVEQYDIWNAQYSEHLDRRTKKWQALMDSYGLNSEKAFRFPPKSDKIKRYVRKGIPPDLRGAAWFWYAGGPSRLAKEPGLYHSLLQQIEQGKLSDNDREHIERDLNRTFPDNIRFKPDPPPKPEVDEADENDDEPGSAKKKKKKNRMTTEPETPILASLRRVLQAFAVHNPSIGYCQSLNFIAGLLLLFLDEDEEKAFVLLEIVTSIHLPGTHGVALEGANIDIAVLMSCIKDALPLVWARLDDKGHNSTAAPFPGPQALRLPTISLATTAWFMSLFVGTLPIESVLRVWDCLFFEGSKTLFRTALAIFKSAEPQIVTVGGGGGDPMEVFQLVQSAPRSMLDINALMELCFKRRGGFAHVSQDLIEKRRADRRKVVQEGIKGFGGEGGEDGKGWKRWRAKAKT